MPAATKSSRARVDQRTRTARAEGRDARGALLDAAVEVFAERGYRDASVDEIAERAGYSKGALYWHFASKDELFYALLDERIDGPWRETIALIESAAPEQDMAPEAGRRLSELLRGERQLMLIDHEYRSQAVRDSKLGRRYAKRQAKLRSALARAIAARLEHLGAPPLANAAEDMATAFMSLISGLAQEKLIDPDAVPDRVLEDTLALIYGGHVARAGRPS